MADLRLIVDPTLRDILSPLSTAEFEALQADIEANGVRVPLVVDEEGRILDGNHRFRVDPNAPFVVKAGLSEPQKKAFVICTNVARRNLSPSQKKELSQRQREVVRLLRADGATQAEAAAQVGVSQQLVAKWEAEDQAKRERGGSNTTSSNASASAATESGRTDEPEEQAESDTDSTEQTETPHALPTEPPPDTRVKINPKHHAVILARLDGGESAEQVAADYGVTARTIRSIAGKERKQNQRSEERKTSAAQTPGDCGVWIGEFQIIGGENVLESSVELVFTDPPYNEEAVGLYQDLGEFAARVLQPGGWCLAYSGEQFLPEVYQALGKYLTYGWTFAIAQTGGDLRFRKLHVQNKWKPILAFYKPPLECWWDWFPDLVQGGGREKADHAWQQAESEAAYFIAALSHPGALICDPMCGSGTTLAAAKALGRRWVGFDCDPDSIGKAEKRVQ